MNLDLLNHKIIITENKKELIEMKSINPFLNFKVINKQELIENLFFSYDNRAKIYLHRLNYKYENSDEILKNLYFLKENISPKIDELISIKKQLERNNLLIKNELFESYLKKSNLLIYNYDENDSELNNIFKQLNIIPLFYNDKTNNVTTKVFEFETLEDEIRYIFEQIGLLIKKNIPLNKIKIVTENKTYIDQLKKYEHFYSFKFNIESEENLYQTKDYKLLKSYLKTTLCEESFSLIYDRIIHTSEFDSLVSQFIKVKDYIKENEIEDFLDYIAKNIKIKNIEYENGIEITTLNKCKNDDIVLLIGFTLGSYPKIYKDEDFLSDNEKKLLNISTSKEKQLNEEIKIITKLSTLKNLKISYAKKNDNDVFFLSLLQEKLNLPIEKYKFSNTIFSKNHFKFFMGKIIDQYENFTYVSPYLNSISKKEINYLTYDNKFDSFSISTPLLKLSPTTIELFNKCSFHYYLSKILFLDTYEDTLSAKLGNLSHFLLENVIKNNPISIDEAKNNFDLNNKESIIVDALKPQLEKMLENFTNFKNITNLKHMVAEDFNFSYKINNHAVLEGRIDLLISNENNFAILDHKTSSVKFDKKMVKFGYSLQLPIYYLLAKSNELYSSKDFLGFYIHHLINKDFYKCKYDYLLFDGITTSEKGFSLIQGNGKFIKPFNKKYEPIDDEEFKNIIEITKKVVEQTSISILSNEFTINPKIINKQDSSCTYCPFNNVCYHTYKDIVYLSNKEEE